MNIVMGCAIDGVIFTLMIFKTVRRDYTNLLLTSVIDLADCEKLLKREITSFDLVAKFPKLNLWKVGNVVKKLVVVLMVVTT